MTLLMIPPGLHRRAFLLALAAPLPVSRARAEDEDARATAFIREAGVMLGDIARRATTPEARRAALKPFLERVVDMADLARFCLGRYWAQADPARRLRYQALLETVILLNVRNRLGSYEGGNARVVVGRAIATGDGHEVPTLVQSGNDAAVRITWRVSFTSGAPRIVDVSAEGISLRVTLRGDFTSWLRQNNGDLDALFAAMERMIAGL